MRITFLVGNGFDISAGMKTSYRDFYEWYWEQDSDTDAVRKLKGIIKADVEAGKENWADFEFAFGKYSENFSVEETSEYLDCYQDVQEKLWEYIKLQCGKYSLLTTEAEKNLFRDGVMNFYKELQPKERAQLEGLINEDRRNHMMAKVVSFNYSDLIDRCVEVLAASPLKTWGIPANINFSVEKKVIHPNGTIVKFPIVGVNDETQIANKEMLSVPNFKEMVIKPMAVDSLGQLWHSEAEQQIASSTIVCVYGMSIGATDAKWWRQLVEWLKGNGARHLIVFWYSKDEKDDISVRKRIESIAKVKEQVLSFSKLREDVKETIIDRIHVVINTKSFLQIPFDEQERGKEELFEKYKDVVSSF